MSMTSSSRSLASMPPPPPIIQLPRAAAALQARALAKLTAITEATEQARDTAQAAMRRRMAALEEMQRAESLRAELAHARVEPQRLKAADVALADAKAAFARRAKLSDDASAAAAPVLALTERLLGYIRDNGSALKPAAPAAVKMGPTAPAVRLHEVRLRIAQLAEEAAAIRRAPAPDSEIATAVRARVDALAETGRPRVSASGSVTWTQTRAQVFDPDGKTAGMALVPDTMAALCWLDADKMTARLTAQVFEERKAAGVAPGLARAERMATLQKLATEILGAERLEEALLVALEEKGSPLPRRPDADPRAILELDGPAPSQS
jgi:hypothetical protein